MKKILTFAVLAAVMLFGFAACNSNSSLEGTYTDASGMVSYVFSDGEASMITGGVTLPLGEFEVRDGNLYIGGIQLGTVSGNTITIAGVQLRRQ